METVVNTMNMILGITMITLLGILVIFMAYAIVHLTQKMEEDNEHLN